MAAVRVNVNPEVLMWAVDYSQRGMDAFEKKFKMFPRWLDKSEQPTVKQLEDMARFAYVPFGYLMLSEKPMIKIRAIKDFRTIQNHRLDTSGEYSAELRDTMIDIRRRQEWLHEYKEAQGYAPIPFIGSIHTDMADEIIVEKICKELMLPADWRDCIDSKDAAFRYFLDIVEAKGVMVFVNGIVGNNTHRRLRVEEFRGFALSDHLAPVIFINGSDAPAARLFTLLHELVHLFLGQDGLDDRTEPFCNRLSAKILVPPALFNEQWHKNPKDFDALERFFKVSPLVLYRMALSLGKIDEKEYARRIALYNKRHQGKNKSAGGDFYHVAPYRAGRSFCRYVREALREGNVSYSEAYQLLGVRGSTFENVMKSIEEGRE